MATEKYSNAPQTTLDDSDGINSTDTAVIVTSATGFPSSGNFRILIDSEIMKVTAVAGSTFTVTRGQEGTLATSHLNLATITHIMTAEVLDNLRKEKIQVGAFASRPTSPFQGDFYRCTDGQYESIYDGSNWRNFLAGGPEITFPSGFSAAGMTADQVDVTRGPTILKYKMPNTSYNWTMQVKNIPSAPYKQRLGFRSFFDVGTGTVPSQVYFGLLVYDSSGGKIWNFGQGDNVDHTGVIYFSDKNTYGGSNPVDKATQWPYLLKDKWLIWEDDNTNWKLWQSIDGSYSNATLVYSMTRNTTFTPDKIGFGMSALNSSNVTLLGEFFDWTLL